MSAVARTPPCIVVHGGAGLPRRASEERETAAYDVMRRSLDAAYAILSNGGSAVDACIEAVKVMEDADVFNAGRGSVLSRDGIVEMDAGIMDGTAGTAGGVSLVKRIKNPIVCAAEVMRRTPHVLLSGAAAEEFARECRLVLVDDVSYFITDHRKKQLEAVLTDPHTDWATPKLDHQVPTGTVGACALDARGSLAAASSTGGMTGKMTGRVSDSSIPGCGFFATATSAVSGTGNGDGFIRTAACRRAVDFAELKSVSLKEACDEVINVTTLRQYPAGMIALDSNGEISTPFNTYGMFHGYISCDCETHLGIYK